MVGIGGVVRGRQRAIVILACLSLLTSGLLLYWAMAPAVGPKIEGNTSSPPALADPGIAGSTIDLRRRTGRER